MVSKKQSHDILGRAMLANVWIGIWKARKHDRRVTSKVNDEMAAHNQHAGRYHKRLFGGDAPSHSTLVTAAHVARTTHYKQTLPWEDSGWRLLPTTNYFEYTKAMREAQVRFEKARDAFLKDYPNLVVAAKNKLGRMYRREDYPEVQHIKRKFHFEVQYGPVPASDDFRISLPKTEMAAMAKSVEDRVRNSVADAMADAWARLGDVVIELREKLDDGKYLRATMITRVGDVAQVLGRLNLTEDPALEQARKQVLRTLATLDVEALRENEKVRKQAAKDADSILASMKGIYTTASAA